MTSRPSREEAEEAVRKLIAWTGDDPTRNGLVETPRRVIDSFAEFFAGYGQSAPDQLSSTVEAIDGYDDVVVVRGIPFSSHCEHHMLPFFGRAHIAYYPDGRLASLANLACAVDVCALRLQTQERLTAEIARTVNNALQARGVAILLEAEHQCMTLRGVRKPGALTTTTMFTGAFREPAEQIHFLNLIKDERGAEHNDRHV